MTFQQSLDAIRAKVERFGDDLDNEEVTKDVLIRPMIKALGYDSSDPTQVKAEFQVTLRKGGRGRADYVIMHNGEPAIVMECKALGVPLDHKIQNQMRQYAQALGAKAGLVTDGDFYLCFANVDDEGRMDDRCYRGLRLSEPNDEDVEALELMSRKRFFPKQFREGASRFQSDLDHRNNLIQVLNHPAMIEELKRIGELGDSSERESEFSATMKFIQQVLSEDVERAAAGDLETPEIDTTSEELDAYRLCQGMLHGVIEPRRVSFRDSKTYASVLIDDNNRKPLCRFHFNGRIKYLGTFDADKQETRHAIEEVDDLLKFARTLRKTAKQYAES